MWMYHVHPKWKENTSKHYPVDSINESHLNLAQKFTWNSLFPNNDFSHMLIKLHTLLQVCKAHQFLCVAANHRIWDSHRCMCGWFWFREKIGNMIENSLVFYASRTQHYEQWNLIKLHMLLQGSSVLVRGCKPQKMRFSYSHYRHKHFLSFQLINMLLFVS